MNLAILPFAGLGSAGIGTNNLHLSVGRGFKPATQLLVPLNISPSGRGARDSEKKLLPEPVQLWLLQLFGVWIRSQMFPQRGSRRDLSDQERQR